VAGEGGRAVALPHRQGSEAALDGLADGTVDIVVGTHKLLSTAT
jgi:transcription-repair coupling factor (superfamily II helicase)